MRERRRPLFLAVHSGLQGRDIFPMWHYTTVDRVANVMRPYLESITA